MQQGIGAVQNQASSDFEVLSDEEPQGHKHIPQTKFDKSLTQVHLPLNYSPRHLPEKMAVIVQDETYVVLEAVEDYECNQQQWLEFIDRKKKQVWHTLESLKKQQQNKHYNHSRLLFRERHTIINLPFQDISKRLQFWSIANYTPDIEQEYIDIETLEQQDRQQRRKIVESYLAPKEVEALRKAVLKTTKLFKNIIDKGLRQEESGLSKEWKEHLIKLRNVQTCIFQWVRGTLERCALEYSHIRYCKGLEYICLGVVFSYPQINYPKYSQLVDFFLKNNQLQELYMDSSPRYYNELHKICFSLREQNSDLYAQIEKRQGDLKNLFVSYFRSCLFYRITNPEVIRKLFELLFAEGIPVMRTIIIRAVNELTSSLLQSQHFLQTITSFILVEYFKCCRNPAEVAMQLQRLFEL